MTEKRRKKKFKLQGMFEIVFDIIEFIFSLIPGKTAMVMLIVGSVAGGVFGYNLGIVDGISQIILPQCPVSEACEVCETCAVCEFCETCETCEVCPEQVKCPEPDPPDCPRPVESYTCEELTQAKAGECVCIPA